MTTQSEQRLDLIKQHLQPTKSDEMAQIFEDVPLAPPDAIFELTARYKADTFEQKINLGVGAYRDDHAKPWVLPVVKKASAKLEAKQEAGQLDHEYLPITGLPTYTNAAQKLVFGKSQAVDEGRVISVQTLSGTGANHLAALFLAKFYKFTGEREVYLSNPTWANHPPIMSNVGLKPSTYAYYDAKTIDLDWASCKADMEKAPEGSVILLHGCAHNPTGVDPTPDQWKELADIFLQKKHFAFFDSAYQGFASGDLDADSASVRLFTDLKVPMLVCQSFAKNAGLYNERVGALHFVGSTKEESNRIRSQLSVLQRSEISSPPAYGANLVTMILTEPELFEQWKADVVTMSHRIIKMRDELYEWLNDKLKTPPPAKRKDWGHIKSQIGMFSFTGLNPQQTKRLVEDYHIYLTGNGRISMAGLTSGNIEYFARSVDEVVRST